VASPRPKVTLIGKSVQPSASDSTSDIQIADQNELPQDAQLTFSIHAQVPAAFSGEEKVEVATAPRRLSDYPHAHQRPDF
jgi:hypothetical protein